jgi:hypothetical protein
LFVVPIDSGHKPVPQGKDQEFYHLAEQELRNEDKSSPLSTPDNL